MTDFAYPWQPDQGDGTFRNPIVYADYSDPDVIRDGDDFWMTASSFNCTPGLPILHSRDLVNWRLVKHAIKNLPDPRGVYDTVQPGCGVWAPAIRKHDGRFWIFFPMPDEGIYVTTATDPAGEWSEPWLLVAGRGLIDPCPLWDDDGQAYLVHAFARSRAGVKDRLRVCRMAPDASRLLDEGRIVFDEPVRHPTCEGPKIHKWNGLYYISAPAGGVPTGWQLVLRSPHIYGPYDEKIVLEQGPTPVNGPHQGAFIDTPRGDWWFAHFQDDGVYGRIVHLQPVTWKDGWPLCGLDHDGNGVGEPVLHHAKPAVTPQPAEIPATSDEFDGQSLGLQWQWHANHRDDWHTLTERPGYLRLHARPSPADLGLTPHLLMQKFPARSFTVDTGVELTSTPLDVEAGLVVMGLSHAALLIAPTKHGYEVRLRIDNEIVAAHAINHGRARLRVHVADGGKCSFSFAPDPSADFMSIGTALQAKEGRWIGAKVGLVCRTGSDVSSAAHADFDAFRFSTG